MFNPSHLFDIAKGALVTAAVDRLYPMRPTRTRDGLLMAGAYVGVGLVGVIVGMLIAPKSGRELRADLASRATDLKDKALEAGQQIGGQISNVAARAGGNNTMEARPSRP